jgi:hypothetical protein
MDFDELIANELEKAKKEVPIPKAKTKRKSWSMKSRIQQSERLRKMWAEKRGEVKSSRMQAHVLVAKDGSQFVTMSASPGLLEFLQTHGFKVIVLKETS